MLNSSILNKDILNIFTRKNACDINVLIQISGSNQPLVSHSIC